MARAQAEPEQQAGKEEDLLRVQGQAHLGVQARRHRLDEVDRQDRRNPQQQGQHVVEASANRLCSAPNSTAPSRAVICTTMNIRLRVDSVPPITCAP